MAMLVSRYKIEIKEEPEFADETFEERYARITAFKQGLTTTQVTSHFPAAIPLIHFQSSSRTVGIQEEMSV